MDDAAPVRGCHRGGDLRGDGQQSLERQAVTWNEVRERAALDQLHCQERPAVIDVGRVDGDDAG